MAAAAPQPNEPKTLVDVPPEIFEKHILPRLKRRERISIALVSKPLFRLYLRPSPDHKKPTMSSLMAHGTDASEPELAALSTALGSDSVLSESVWAAEYLGMKATGKKDLLLKDSILAERGSWKIGAIAFVLFFRHKDAKDPHCALLIRGLQPGGAELAGERRPNYSPQDPGESSNATEAQLLLQDIPGCLAKDWIIDQRVESVRLKREVPLGENFTPSFRTGAVAGTDILAIHYSDVVTQNAGVTEVEKKGQFLSFVSSDATRGRIQIAFVDAAAINTARCGGIQSNQELAMQLLNQRGLTGEKEGQTICLGDGSTVAGGWRLLGDPRRMLHLSESHKAPRPVMGKVTRPARYVEPLVGPNVRLFRAAHETANLIYDLTAVFPFHEVFVLPVWAICPGTSRREQNKLNAKHRDAVKRKNLIRQRNGLDVLLDTGAAPKSSTPNVKGSTVVLVRSAKGGPFRLIVCPTRLPVKAVAAPDKYMGLLGPLSTSWNCYPESWWRLMAEFVCSKEFRDQAATFVGNGSDSFHVGAAQSQKLRDEAMKIDRSLPQSGLAALAIRATPAKAAKISAVILTNIPATSKCAVAIVKLARVYAQSEKCGVRFPAKGKEGLYLAERGCEGGLVIQLFPTSTAAEAKVSGALRLKKLLQLLRYVKESVVEGTVAGRPVVPVEGEAAGVVALGLSLDLPKLQALLQEPRETLAFLAEWSRRCGDIVMSKSCDRKLTDDDQKELHKKAGVPNLPKSDKLPGWKDFSLRLIARAQYPNAICSFIETSELFV